MLHSKAKVSLIEKICSRNRWGNLIWKVHKSSCCRIEKNDFPIFIFCWKQYKVSCWLFGSLRDQHCLQYLLSVSFTIFSSTWGDYVLISITDQLHAFTLGYWSRRRRLRDKPELMNKFLRSSLCDDVSISTNSTANCRTISKWMQLVLWISDSMPELSLFFADLKLFLSRWRQVGYTKEIYSLSNLPFEKPQICSYFGRFIYHTRDIHNKERKRSLFISSAVCEEERCWSGWGINRAIYGFCHIKEPNTIWMS